MIEGGSRLSGNPPKISPLVTIITVVLNGEKHIERTIQNALSQKRQNLEYIIIDGASKDATIQVIKKYNALIDYWLSESDTGLYDAMNKGIRFAKGQYIGFLNSGDLYCDNTFDLLYDAIQKFDSPAVIYGDTFIYNQELEIKVLQKAIADFSQIKKRMIACHQSMFIKKTVYDQLGCFNLKYRIAADYEILTRLDTRQNKTVYINQPLSLFHEGGFSNNFRLDIDYYKIQRKNGLQIWAFIKLIKSFFNYFFYYTRKKLFILFFGIKKYETIRKQRNTR